MCNYQFCFIDQHIREVLEPGYGQVCEQAGSSIQEEDTVAVRVVGINKPGGLRSVVVADKIIRVGAGILIERHGSAERIIVGVFIEHREFGIGIIKIQVDHVPVGTKIGIRHNRKTFQVSTEGRICGEGAI